MPDAPAPLLVVLLGPTAVGKTALAVALAQRWGCSVTSADSRQCYRGMEIGTGKPTAAERAGVAHYGLDTLTPDQPTTAADFAQRVEALLPQLWAQAPVQVVAGGTGFYVRALLEGLDALPEVSPALRAAVAADLAAGGLPRLLAELDAADPGLRIDRQNPARVSRAVELLRASGGVPVSALRTGRRRALPWRTLVVGLDLERAALHRRIEARVQAMFDAGLVDEVRALVQRYGPQAPGLQSIGYTEVMAHLAGAIDLDECIRQVQAHSRQYARRQLTWMRRVAALHWLDAARHIDEQVATVDEWRSELSP